MTRTSIKSLRLTERQDSCIAIHDVDKDGEDRSSPAINAHDNGPDIRMAHGTNSINPKTAATPSTAFTQTKNGRILVNDGVTNRVQLGALPDGTFGMKVSQLGNDVTTASDAKMVFNSNNDVFKIVSTGQVTIPGGTPVKYGTGPWYFDTETAGFVHNLGFIPLVVASINYGVNYTMLPSTILEAGFTIAGFGQSSFEFGSTSTNAFFDRDTRIYNPADSAVSAIGVYVIKYYLLQETAN